MRLRICRPPTRKIDGFDVDTHCAGSICELGPQLANVFMAEGWAEPVARVLLIDDDAELRALTISVLIRDGYDVVEARHGNEAIRMLAEYSPDVIVLDLEMPVMDGWQFRAEQQSLPDARLANIPVLLMTAVSSAEEQVAPLRAVGLIPKPFDPDRLLAAIRAALQA